MTQHYGQLNSPDLSQGDRIVASAIFRSQVERIVYLFIAYQIQPMSRKDHTNLKIYVHFRSTPYTVDNRYK